MEREARLVHRLAVPSPSPPLAPKPRQRDELPRGVLGVDLSTHAGIVAQAEAAAKDFEIAAQREQFRRLREGELAEFDDIKTNLVEESRRAMGAAVWDAKKAEEAAVQARWDETIYIRKEACTRPETPHQQVRLSLTPGSYNRMSWGPLRI